MKKYLKMIGYIALYLGVLYLTLTGVHWFVFNICSKNKALSDFLWSNKTLFSFSISIISVSVYCLIFKLRKKSLFKVCNFSKISTKGILGITGMGISMSLFTTCFTGISYVGGAFPQFETYMKSFFESKGSVFILIIMLIVLPMFEEIIFRGMIFNELRTAIPIVPAVILQAVIYGVLQFNPVLGTYAAVGSIIYVLPYIWCRSLWGSILVQDTCILSLFVMRRSGIKDLLIKTGDTGLLVLTLTGIVGMIVSAYFLWKDCNKQHTTGPKLFANLSSN